MPERGKRMLKQHCFFIYTKATSKQFLPVGPERVSHDPDSSTGIHHWMEGQVRKFTGSWARFFSKPDSAICRQTCFTACVSCSHSVGFCPAGKKTLITTRLCLLLWNVFFLSIYTFLLMLVNTYTTVHVSSWCVN